MKITLKLYTKLGKYLPENSSKNEAVIEVEENSDVERVLDQYGVPFDQRHLVMLNGIHIMPAERAKSILSASDSLAVWPPTTG